MLVCNKCGSENSDSSNFCSNCGTRLGIEPSNDTTRVIPVVASDNTAVTELRPEDSEVIGSLTANQGLLIVTRGDLVGSRFLLDKPVTTTGRHPDSDFFLDDITVSRHHARFLLKDGRFMVEDQESLNGTYINRTLVDHCAPLRSGDEVQIGKFRMLFFTKEAGTN